MPAFEYVFETSALRAAGSADSGLTAALAATAPVATFGSADAQVTVRQAVADSAAVVSAARPPMRALGARPSKSCCATRQCTPAATRRAVLQSGQLDLRAATVLAYLANSTTVQLTNVSPDAAEQAAGLPIRSVDVTIGAPAVMQTIVSGLPVAYQPASVTPPVDGRSAHGVADLRRAAARAQLSRFQPGRRSPR